MSKVCHLCGEDRLRSQRELDQGVCARCREAPGFWSLPPLSRRLRACAGCGGREFIRALAQERASAGIGHPVPYVSPLGVAFRRRTTLATFSREPRVEVNGKDMHEQLGWLEMLICRACGAVSWFAIDPSSIPIGPEFGTELCRVADEDPYR
jgi:hypothetical protein